MVYYEEDKRFTDNMHKVATELIYPLLKWKVVKIDYELSKYMDNDDGIDYVISNENDDIIYVQERFRRNRYGRYNDITLRYKREYSKYLTERLSEFYKIHDKIMRDRKQKFYFLYAISNEQEDNFSKYVVIDLVRFFKLFNDKKICVDKSLNSSNTSIFINGILYSGINENNDFSSSFITFDVSHLNQFNNLLLIQKGFII